MDPFRGFLGFLAPETMPSPCQEHAGEPGLLWAAHYGAETGDGENDGPRGGEILPGLGLLSVAPRNDLCADLGREAGHPPRHLLLPYRPLSLPPSGRSQDLPPQQRPQYPQNCRAKQCPVGRGIHAPTQGPDEGQPPSKTLISRTAACAQHGLLGRSKLPARVPAAGTGFSC